MPSLSVLYQMYIFLSKGEGRHRLRALGDDQYEGTRIDQRYLHFASEMIGGLSLDRHPRPGLFEETDDLLFAASALLHIRQSP